MDKKRGGRKMAEKRGKEAKERKEKRKVAE